MQGKSASWREGLTVAGLLEERGDSYPYAVVKINGRIVPQPLFDTTVIPDDSEVFLVPMIAGG